MFKIQFEIKSKMTAYVWAISGYDVLHVYVNSSFEILNDSKCQDRVQRTSNTTINVEVMVYCTNTLTLCN